MVEPRNLKAPEVTEQDSRTWVQVVAQKLKEPPQITKKQNRRLEKKLAEYSHLASNWDKMKEKRSYWIKARQRAAKQQFLHEFRGSNDEEY